MLWSESTIILATVGLVGIFSTAMIYLIVATQYRKHQ